MTANPLKGLEFAMQIQALCLFMSDFSIYQNRFLRKYLFDARVSAYRHTAKGARKGEGLRVYFEWQGLCRKEFVVAVNSRNTRQNVPTGNAFFDGHLIVTGEVECVFCHAYQTVQNELPVFAPVKQNVSDGKFLRRFNKHGIPMRPNEGEHARALGKKAKTAACFEGVGNERPQFV